MMRLTVAKLVVANRWGKVAGAGSGIVGGSYLTTKLRLSSMVVLEHCTHVFFTVRSGITAGLMVVVLKLRTGIRKQTSGSL
jgi:hypothetical protein